MKKFLSPVAGQVVDVGACCAGGVALLRVDLAFRPIGEKKSEKFSKSRGRPSSRCRRVLGRPVALLRVDVENFPIAPRKILLHAPAGSHLTTIRRGTLLGEKFSKFFLSALAGQVVDVGASLAGGLTRRRVDVDWRAIANDRAGEGATCR